jgi:hypothetical protein
LPATTLALGATYVVQGPNGTREIAAADFYIGFLESALAPDEMLTEIRVPKMNGATWGFQKFNRRAQDWAIVGVAAWKRGTGRFPAATGPACQNRSPHLSHRFGFFLNVKSVGGVCLHAKCGLHGMDARFELRVDPCALFKVKVQLFEQCKLLRLCFWGPSRILEKRDHLQRVEIRVIDIDALVLGGKKTIGPKLREADWATGT